MVKIIAALDGLKQNPLALALVLVNLLFLAWGVYLMNSFADAAARRDALITSLVERCK